MPAIEKTIKEMAVDLTVKLTAILENSKGKTVFINQILRSASSIGANAYEAKYAQSKLDFVNKLEISLKECYETEYWLEILQKTGGLEFAQYDLLLQTCGTIRRMLIASITKVKSEL